MHLKQKAYSFGVLLIYAITTISLSSVGSRSDSTGYPSKLKSNLALHDDRNRVLTATRPPNREGTKRLNLSSKQGEGSRKLPHFPGSDTGTRAQASGRRPGRKPGPRMASTAAGKPERTDGERVYTSLNPPHEACSEGNIQQVLHGKFTVTGHLEANVPNVGYQSDSAVSVQAQGGQERARGQQVSGSEESWQRLQPVVECGDDAMTLTVRRRRAVQLLLDRVNESSVPLSQLPPQCGYSVQTTWRDLSLMAQYDACHVTQEDDRYVLPLLWRGTPARMSCPVSQIQPQAVSPPSLCCSPHGMTIKVRGLFAAGELMVNVRGQWTPLVVLAEQCGYSLDRRDAEIIIAAPFITCGITEEDGRYTLSLQIGDKTFTLACPIPPPEELPLTHQPLVQTESLEPFPWAPPFYLAPPYYPHPTYQHKYPSPDFGVHSSQPSTDELEDSSQVNSNLQQNQETPVLALSEKHSVTHAPTSVTQIHSEARPLHPPSHAFSQYYHYYHHPKIPLPGPPQDPDPGPVVHKAPSLTNPHNPEFTATPPSVHQSEALSRVNPDQFLQPAPEAASYPTSPEFIHKASAPHTPHLPQPYPHHYFYYFPHIARGEARRSAPLDTAAKTHYQNMKPSVHPQTTRSSDKYNLNSHVDRPKPEEVISFQKNSPHPLLFEEDVKAELGKEKRHSAVPLPLSYPPGPDPVAVPPPEQPTPSPNHNLPPYPYYYYYYHPYYHYYPMYYGHENLLGAENHASPTSSKAALDPQHQASSSTPHPSYRKHQTTAPPKQSTADVHNVHPYYYYNHHPKLDDQEIHPSVSTNSEDASSKSEPQLQSDYSGTDWAVHAAEAGYPSIPQPQHSPFHNLYYYYITQQQPYDPSGHHDGEEAGERLHDEMKDHLEANPSTPSASPCGLGPVSDFDCSVSSGCCSYSVKDCTMGQHLIFAVPDSVVEPAVAPPAHRSEVSNVSCTLQRLTSDPDIYIIPLDGCGVNQQVFGPTVLHQLEVPRVHSLQQDPSSVHDNSPVRLMVECSSSPGSPGEVRLHVMDPPPVQSTPATVTVHLRLATDESFTSFHPEAHQPLSVMRGRPVYVEVSLLDAPEPGLVLLVHSCLAYTQAPYTSWMLVYDGCPSRGDSQTLPSPRSDPHHIRRIVISSFLALPSESPPDMAKGGYPHLEDPEIYFLCLTEVCAAADGECTVGCINSPNGDT